MTAPKPVVLTQRAAVTGERAPEPLVIVGTIPGGAITKSAHIANATTFADLTAATTAYNALLANLQTAGIMA